MTTYELLAGRHPWPPRAERLNVGAAILTEPAPPLAVVAPFLPAGVVEVLDRALSKRPEERFASMEELIALLEPYASQSGALGSLPRVPPPVEPSGKSRGESSASLPETLAPPPEGSGDEQPAAPPVHRTPGTRLFVSLAVLVFGGVVAMSALRGPRDAVTPSAPPLGSIDAAPPPKTALAITDLPRPVTGVPAAAGAYASALQALRDGNGAASRTKLAETVAADPGMGPAQMRYALVTIFPSSDGSRKAFAQAVQLRGTMSVYDEALLDGIEPILDRMPQDWAESERRLSLATAKLPEDAELFGVLGWIRAQIGDVKGMREATTAALALDPKYARVLLTQAGGVDRRPHGDAARGVGVHRPLLAVAVECIKLRMITLARGGDCAAYERDARRARRHRARRRRRLLLAGSGERRARPSGGGGVGVARSGGRALRARRPRLST